MSAIQLRERNILTKTSQAKRLLKQAIGKFFAHKGKTWLKLLINYTYDFQRFIRFSTASSGGLLTISNTTSKANLRALITMEYHRIEKALALKETRTAFGASTIQRLIKGIEAYQKLYGSDELIQVAVNNLLAYHQFNSQRGYEDSDLYSTIFKLQKYTETQLSIPNDEGGVSRVCKEEIWAKAKLDLRDFFASRYSIRNFTSEEVDLRLIEQAVIMAQKTPSVCNRQSSKVYVFSREEDKKLVLSYQNGNSGFGHLVDKVLIVTSDLQNFASVGERNQCWIDGGMYAMSVIYALHSLGLGTCCLNWSVEYKVDRQMRKAAGISDSEAVIMMIGVGHLPDEFMVAQSSRKKIDEVLIVK
jgi:nitroreductase